MIIIHSDQESWKNPGKVLEKSWKSPGIGFFSPGKAFWKIDEKFDKSV